VVAVVHASQSSSNRAIATRCLLALTVVTVVLVGSATGSSARDLAREEPDAARELAERYAPIVMIKAQDEPCDADGEPYAPTSVDIVLDNPEVVLRQLGGGDPVLMRAPGASDLFGLGEGVFLDFPGSSLDPGCLYETDFDRFSSGTPPVVYAHIVQEEGHPDQLALQYWLYWYYNDWNNTHESDWEGIQVLFDASTIEEALADGPVEVGYAQHKGGEAAAWTSSKLEREGDRPVVYPSAGSHASYFGSAVYLGRGASEGFGCDTTDGPSERLDPDVVVLPASVSSADDPVAWLAYEGRWGERQPGPFNGPTGLLTKERWTNPVSWQEDLRPGSVVIPGGDSAGAAVVSSFCGVVEWGSGLYLRYTASPARVAIGLAAVVAALAWFARRTSWTRTDVAPVVGRRRAGQILRTAVSTYRSEPVALVTLGLVYLPTAMVIGVLAGILGALPLIREIFDLAGTNSGSGLLIAALIGSFANAAAFVAVNAMAAAYLATVDTPDETSAIGAADRAWGRRRELLGGLARSYAVVIGLLITIVGAPWAIRQLVRYQFMAHVVVIEGASGQNALARSSALVKGRWWHTAAMVAAINGLIGLAGLSIGLLMLVIFTGLPLWLFSSLITLVYALVTPGAAIAMTLLYGDAVAYRDAVTDETLLVSPAPARH
jgi:hypothetical protein